MDDNNIMVYLNGSKKSFRCSCGANVFHRTGTDRVACNGCDVGYTTEPATPKEVSNEA